MLCYFDLGQVNHEETKAETNKQTYIYTNKPITKLRMAVLSMKDSLLQDTLSFVIDSMHIRENTIFCHVLVLKV